MMRGEETATTTVRVNESNFQCEAELTVAAEYAVMCDVGGCLLTAEQLLRVEPALSHPASCRVSGALHGEQVATEPSTFTARV